MIVKIVPKVGARLELKHKHLLAALTRVKGDFTDDDECVCEVELNLDEPGDSVV